MPTRASSLAHLDGMARSRGFRAQIHAATGSERLPPPRHSYLLSPMSAHLGLVYNPTKHPNFPSLGAYLKVDHVGLGVEQEHMHSLLCAQAWYATKRYRPLRRPRKGGVARAWWWYALKSTVGQAQSKSSGGGEDKRWDFGVGGSRILGLSGRRKRYIELYKRQLNREEKDLRDGKPGEHPTPKPESDEMTELEQSFAVRQAVLFRIMASKYLDAEIRARESAEQQLKKHGKGTMGAFFGMAGPSKADEARIRRLESESAMRMGTLLIAGIDLQAVDDASQLAPDYEKMRLEVALGKAVLSLKKAGAMTPPKTTMQSRGSRRSVFDDAAGRSPGDGMVVAVGAAAGGASEGDVTKSDYILQASIGGRFAFVQRPTSWAMELALDDARVMDGATPDTQFPTVLAPTGWDLQQPTAGAILSAMPDSAPPDLAADKDLDLIIRGDVPAPRETDPEMDRELIALRGELSTLRVLQEKFRKGKAGAVARAVKPFGVLRIESHPLEETSGKIRPMPRMDIDYRVSVGFLPCEIVMAAPLVEAVGVFFCRPVATAMSSRFSSELSATLEAMNQSMQQDFYAVMASKPTIDMRVCVGASHVLWPDRCESLEAPLLVAELGELWLLSRGQRRAEKDEELVISDADAERITREQLGLL